MSRSEFPNSKCLICGSICTAKFHFGGLSCNACASFFRRTVSLNIRYLCKNSNNCITSPGQRTFCKACRYESCVDKAGMKRDLVQQRRSTNATPKYILNSTTGSSNREVVRGFITDSNSHLFTQTDHLRNIDNNEHCKDMKKYSDILEISHMNLLRFYVKQVEPEKKELKNILQIKSINDLMITCAYDNGSAMESCVHCPGAGKLSQEDVRLLQKSFQFAHTWLDSTWQYSIATDIDESEVSGESENLSQFISHIKSTLGACLANLKLDVYEFAAFKSFCVWSIRAQGATESMKVVAQDHYEAVCSALKMYYKTFTSMTDSEMTTRIEEISFGRSPDVQMIYEETIKLYNKIGIPKSLFFEGN